MGGRGVIPIDKAWPVAAGARWELQRGAQYVLACNFYPPGDFAVAAVGIGPPPVLRIPAGLQIASLALAPVAYAWTGIHLTGDGSGNGIAASRGATLSAVDCIIQGFTNGVVYGGVGALMRGLAISACSTGIFGGSNGYAAPSGGLIQRCTVRGTRDAITLHDGSGLGVGNVIEDCDLFGDAENGIDILAQYPDTVVQRNHIESARSYPAIWDAPRLTLHANTLRGTRAAVYARGADAIIVGNSIPPMASDAAATLMAFAPGATGQRVHGNAGAMRADTKRVGLMFEPGSSGRCSANDWTNESALALYGGALDQWGLAPP